jgi:hypothetical protein
MVIKILPIFCCLARRPLNADFSSGPWPLVSIPESVNPKALQAGTSSDQSAQSPSAMQTQRRVPPLPQKEVPHFHTPASGKSREY